MIAFDIGSLSDIGNVRNSNQDSILVLQDSNISLIVVADGMGGMTCGEKASTMVTTKMSLWWEDIKDNIKSLPEDMIVNILYDEINYINMCIINYCKDNGIKTGTTITILLIVDDLGIIAFSGDSRVYQIRDNKVIQMTEDETLYNYFEKNNIEGNSEKNKNVLINYVGMSENFSLSVQITKIYKDDIYVLCTDGFYNYHNMYSNDSLFILTNNSAQGSVDLFVDKIKQMEASDNLSIVVVKCK